MSAIGYETLMCPEWRNYYVDGGKLMQLTRNVELRLRADRDDATWEAERRERFHIQKSLWVFAGLQARDDRIQIFAQQGNV